MSKDEDHWKRKLDMCLLAWAMWRARSQDLGEGYGQTAYSRALSGEAVRGAGYRSHDHAIPEDVLLIEEGLTELGKFNPQCLEALQFYLEHPNISVGAQAAHFGLKPKDYFDLRRQGYEYLRGHVFRSDLRKSNSGLRSNGQLVLVPK